MHPQNSGKQEITMLKSVSLDIKGRAEKVHRIRVRLYPNYLPGLEGTCHARTIHENLLTIADIAAALKNRAGANIDIEDIIHFYNQIIEEIEYQLCDGYAVDMGPVAVYPRVGGTWKHVNEAGQHEDDIGFVAHIRNQLARLKNDITLICDGMAANPAYIDEVLDVFTGNINETLTINRNLVITGQNIQVSGELTEDCGLFLVYTSPTSGLEMPLVIQGPFVQNSRNKIVALVPEGVTPGMELAVRIVTKYSNGSTILKEPRIIDFKTKLTVLAAPTSFASANYAAAAADAAAAAAAAPAPATPATPPNA
jgi:hypothetical protein